MATSDQEGTTGPSRQRAQQPADEAARRGKRRGWWLLAGIPLAVLIALVAFAPPLLSSSISRDLLTDFISRELKGEITCRRIRLTWSGPCKVWGLRVIDTQGRDVLEVEELVYGNGLLMLASNATAFRQVIVTSPMAVLYLDEAGRSSLAEALSARVPAPRDASEMAEATGKVALKGGGLRIVKADGQSYRLGNVNAEFDLATLDKVTGKITFELEGGAKIQGELAIEGLAPAGAPSLGQASGSFALSTDRPVDLAGLAQFFGAEKLEGAVTFNVAGEIALGELSAEIELTGSELRWPSVTTAAAGAVDLTLKGEVAVSSGQVKADLDVTSDVGNIQADLAYTRCDKPLQRPWGDELAQLLSGQPVDLPEFDISAAGQLDLPALAAAMPSLVGVLPGVEITSGTIIVKGLEVRGGARPSAEGSLALVGLRALKAGKEISPGRVAMSFNASVEREAGLTVGELAFESGFGTAEGAGTLDDLSASVQIDLQKLRSEFGGIFDFVDKLPRGVIDGTVELTAAGDGRSDFNLTLVVTEFGHRLGQRDVSFDKVDLTCDGHLTMQNRRPVQAVVESGRLQLGQDLEGSFSGSYDIDSRAFKALVNVEQADLEAMGDLLAHGLPDWLAELTGRMDLTTSVAIEPGKGLALAEGELTLTELAYQGKPVTGAPVEVEWTELRLAEDWKAIKLESASLASEPVELTARDVSMVLDGSFAPTGSVELTADIAKCIAAAGPFAKWDQPPNIAGMLTWKGQCAPGDKGISISGAGRVEGMEVVSGGQTIRQGAVTFDHAGVLDAEAKALTLSKMNVISEMLSLQITGAATDIAGNWLLDLKGSYRGQWDQLMPLVYQFAPDAQQRVSFAGKTSGQITIRGPARQPDIRPTYRGLDASIPVAWQEGQVLGIKLGEATLALKLSNGSLVISPTVVAVDGGKVHMGGRIDFTRDHPAYVLPDRTMLLEDLPITRQLSQDLLSRFNPIFAELTTVEGRISMEVEGLDLPLDEEIKKSGRGRGRLDLRRLNVEPKGMLAELLRLVASGPQAQRKMTVRNVDFVIRDGRIHYEQFVLVFAEDFELEFYGSVGFDDTLDLAVLVPVSLPLLKKLGVIGPLADYARVLEGVRIAIPMVGTRLKPKLDLAKVDIGKLVEKAAKVLLEEALGDILGGMLKVPIR